MNLVPKISSARSWYTASAKNLSQSSERRSKPQVRYGKGCRLLHPGHSRSVCEWVKQSVVLLPGSKAANGNKHGRGVFSDLSSISSIAPGFRELVSASEQV